MRIFHWRLVGVCLLLTRPGWSLELTLASPSEFSAEQYTQETCILIVSERDSLAPASQRYLELDDSFHRHCQLTVELPRKQGLPSATVQPSHLSSVPPKHPPVPPGSGIQALGTNDTSVHSSRQVRDAMTLIQPRVPDKPQSSLVAHQTLGTQLREAYQASGTQVYLWLLLVLPVLLIAHVLPRFPKDSARVRGAAGEQAIAALIKSHYRGERYGLFTNLLVPLADGGSTEVDLVLITQTHVLALESKHYRGWIFGSSRARSWRQVLHGKHYSFPNPIHQNFGHCEALKKVMQLDKVHSLVVFGADASFKTSLPHGVILLSGMLAYLDMLDAEPASLAQADVARCFVVAEELMQTSGEAAQRAHIDYVRSVYGAPLDSNKSQMGQSARD
ncbi:nuclease-related domain-containing protein [Shewanella sp. FJAT-52076]|uniref:nuclease-related domain-containing protein n=1 Tax=Shewanella sp. FJAT-52076 TaxID=2864202 RepID=UPI001C65688F|nr:nuclease-related domain-containing protein [Shewanella sp. FJAT-52076]QYJ76939.1 NERD domain-containing protein [Shewanella sp. FJAT-52076]